MVAFVVGLVGAVTDVEDLVVPRLLIGELAYSAGSCGVGAAAVRDLLVVDFPALFGFVAGFVGDGVHWDHYWFNHIYSFLYDFFVLIMLLCQSIKLCLINDFSINRILNII